MSEEPKKEEPVKLPEVRIYFDEKSNLKMDYFNSNIYMVIGMLVAVLKRLKDSLGGGKPMMQTVPAEEKKT